MPSSYAGDPRWITAKWSGTDAKGLAFRAGDRVFYYPKGKRIYAGVNADRASADFESARGDEDFYNGLGNAYAS